VNLSLGGCSLFNVSNGAGQVVMSNILLSTFTSTASTGALINAANTTSNEIIISVLGLTLEGVISCTASTKGLIYVANSSLNVNIQSSNFGSVLIRFFFFFFFK
jgi:hypothetical protein